ncbi:hypothetical protein G9A89_016554 [Geosiphon pyriformis]|nr:hypothetical protein G9A89_016554 [Geosiphon pyriformis]
MSNSYNYSSRDNTAPGYPSEHQPPQNHQNPQPRAAHLLPPHSAPTSSHQLNRLLNSDDHARTHPNPFSLPPLTTRPVNYPQTGLHFPYPTQPPPTSQFRQNDYSPLSHAIQQPLIPRQHQPQIPPYASSTWEYSEPQRTGVNSFKMDQAPPGGQTIPHYPPSVNHNLTNLSTAIQNPGNHPHISNRRPSNQQIPISPTTNQHPLGQQPQNSHLMGSRTTNPHSQNLLPNQNTIAQHIPSQHEISQPFAPHTSDSGGSQGPFFRPPPVMSIPQLLSLDEPIEHKPYPKSQNGSKNQYNVAKNGAVDASPLAGTEYDDDSAGTVTDVEQHDIRNNRMTSEDDVTSPQEAGSTLTLQKQLEEVKIQETCTERKSNSSLKSPPEAVLAQSSEIYEISESPPTSQFIKRESDFESNYSSPNSPKSPSPEIAEENFKLESSANELFHAKQVSNTLLASSDSKGTIKKHITQNRQQYIPPRSKLTRQPPSRLAKSQLLLVSTITESEPEQDPELSSGSSTITASELRQINESSEFTESSGFESDSDLDVIDDSKYGDQLVDYMVDIFRRQQRVIEKHQQRCGYKKAKLNKKFLAYSQNRMGNQINLLDKENRFFPILGLRGDKSKIDKNRFSRQLNLEISSFADDGSEVERIHEEAHSKKIQKQREAYEEEERRRIWRDICRNAIPRMSKIVAQSTSSRANNCRKISQLCQKEARKAAFKSCKSSKDVQTKARQAMRQMLMFWKRNEKEEREMRKKAEREALERMRVEEELREAKRQARKLNFLITQTELYSHFVGKKIGTHAAEDTAETSAAAPFTEGSSSVESKTDDNMDEKIDLENLTAFTEIDFDAEDDEALKVKARASAQNALAQVKAHTRHFDGEKGLSSVGKSDMSVTQQDFDQMNFQNPTSMPSLAEIKQPNMLMCQLKEYQLKGLNWLASLYEQGINGILADEMGLGKTVQSISLMAHLAETHNIWGPFLVIAPSSTLHNWQQEISRFVPSFKPLPYWGNPNDRKTLRKFLNRKNLVYTKDAPFHVVITSYQLIVQDKSYFDRTKWQYMVLDEAQAIKSSSSARWKTLLAFQCRNRLLLTGTPIQNSMQELWALLHFIMPTLFDSHQEFSEWFSKDIESHAENKGSLNEHQLRRLHMILKPFMLRRVKKNVQNELGDKIELEVFCELNARQRMLYRGLREKISVAELLEKATSLNDNESVDSLMNLVMQFRKVCNHPELFERADVTAPLAFCKYSMTFMISREAEFMYIPYSSKNVIEYKIPKLIYRDGGVLNVPGHHSNAGFQTKYLDHLMNIWRPDYIQECLREENGAFSFLRFVDTSPSEASSIFFSHALQRWIIHLLSRAQRVRRRFYATSNDESYAHAPINTYGLFLIMETAPTTSLFNVENSSVLGELTNISEHSRYEFTILDPCYLPKAVAPPIELVCFDKCFFNDQERLLFDQSIRTSLLGANRLLPGLTRLNDTNRYLLESDGEGLFGTPACLMRVPAMKKLIMDSGKLAKLDKLLEELKAGGHRVLIYFQMTRMIDLMEEYLAYRQYKYLRLDGGSKISDRRDMVSDWQTRPEIFIFLLSTRAGGLGINLTAADTVIFYDSDWNPTVDQQAMDRAHRLGQTKQVTVYRLITKGTIEERILQRAKQKDEIQKVVISGGEFKQVDFKPREIVSLLLEDDELENKLREQQLKRKVEEEEGTKTKKKGKRQKKDKEAIKIATANAADLSSKRINDLWHEEDVLFEDGSGANTPEASSSISGSKKKKASPKQPLVKTPIKAKQKRPSRSTRSKKKDDETMDTDTL